MNENVNDIIGSRPNTAGSKRLARAGTRLDRRNFLLSTGVGGVALVAARSLADEPGKVKIDDREPKKTDDRGLMNRISIVEIKCNGTVVPKASDGTYTLNPGKIEVKTNPIGDSGTILAMSGGMMNSTGGIRPMGSDYVTWDPYEILGSDQQLTIPSPDDPFEVATATLNVVTGNGNGKGDANERVKYSITFDPFTTSGTGPLLLTTSGSVTLGGTPISTVLNLALVPLATKKPRRYQVVSDELGRWVKNWVAASGKYKFFAQTQNKKAKKSQSFEIG
jgi:hypothetical protein